MHRRNRHFKPLDRSGAVPSVIFPAEPVGFEAAVIRHHMLKADMSQPIQLKQLVWRQLDKKPTIPRSHCEFARAVTLAPTGAPDGIAEHPQLRMTQFQLLVVR